MKTKYRPPSINILSLGCSKNLVDSENLLTQLQANKIKSGIDQTADSETVIVNTCGFIEDAKEQSIEVIMDCVAAKQAGKIQKIIVMGCLSQRYRAELQQELPEVDHFFGTQDLSQILKTLDLDLKHNLLDKRVHSGIEHYAYLKISEGCNRKCAFCAIPLMRGKHVSKPLQNLITEASHLIQNGVKEIMLIGQDLTFYGLDLDRKNKLAELLENLADLKGLEWLRLHYAFPTGFPLDILEVMAKRPNICKYLDIPLQHASDSILKRMRRGITQAKMRKLIEKIRAIVPNIAIRTTFIVGFPGETEADFQELLDFIAELRFERVGVFTYSHEEDTYAYRYEDNVNEETKNKRAEALMNLQASISLEKNIRKVGQVYRVLFDRIEAGFLVGRTEHDSPEVDNQVLVPQSDSNKIGRFYNVKINDANEFDLYGEII